MNNKHPSNIKIKCEQSNILISAKKIESESRKKKVEDKIQNLIEYLLKVLNYEKIHEVSFSLIYNICYNISIEKGGSLLQESYDSNLKNYLITFFHNCKKFQDVDEAIFFRNIVDGYYNFIKKIEVIQKTLLYHEKNYLFKNNLPNIKENAKSHFEKNCLLPIKDRMSAFIKSNIDMDRENIFIDKNLIKDIVGIFLGINDYAYDKFLKQDLIDCTKSFYTEDFIKNINRPTTEYINYVKQRISSEEMRIVELNLVNSRNELISMISESMVLKLLHDEKRTISYIKQLLKLNDSISLNTLKEISSYLYINKFIEILAKSFEEQGREVIIEKCSYIKKVNNNNISANSDENINLINSLVDFFDRVDSLKKDININQNKSFCGVISSKLSNVVNNKDYRLLIPKVLPKHVDHYFKSFLRTKPESGETNSYLEKIVNILRFVIDKDVFELNHRSLLSFRLLNGCFYEEIETKLLSMLKLENGTVYTHRCEVMINDLKTSAGVFESYLNTEFSHKKLKFSTDVDKSLNSLGIYSNMPDFNIKILTPGNWILNNDESVSSKILLEMSVLPKFSFLEIINCFDLYYSSRFHNKNLCYNLFLGSCDVYAKFKSKNYSINMSPFHAFLILFLKNNKSSLSQTLEFFKINEKNSIINNIITLVKSEIIITDNQEGLINLLKNFKNESLSSIHLQINNKFYNKQQRLKISTMRYVNEKISQSEDKSNESVILHRKYLIESNIIRIMKSKKMCAHNELITELLSSVNNIFIPELNDVKQRIESLIERGYMSRSKENFTTYEYTF
jgi:hypothetical protein